MKQDRFNTFKLHKDTFDNYTINKKKKTRHQMIAIYEYTNIFSATESI